VYDQAYDKAIERIESQPPKKSTLARNVLSWIPYVQRQLTTGELCHDLAVVLGEEDLDEDNLLDVEDIVSVCAGLVTVDEESNIIRLVHYTTQEYFERTREKWNPRAELEIASACLTYLSFHPFRSGSCPSNKEFESRLEQNAFLDYASRYWGQHARTVQEQVFEVASLFLQDGNLVSCAVQTMSMSGYKYTDYSQIFPRQATSVHLTARFGLLYLSERLLSQPSGNISISADSKDSYGRTPLSWAAERGHEAVVKLLLEDGAELESKDEDGQTPLSWAASKGHEAVVKLLLEKGAELESKSKYGQTPLSWAAEHGHEAVVKLLLEKGAELESKEKYGQTPLSWAALKGHEAVVKLLLEKGAKLESNDNKYGRTPLIIPKYGNLT
jgi:ankyrin repeat protein